jgi:hypothetical protein
MDDKIAITEFQAIREELLFRLKAQQEIISYSLVVLGALAPILGLSEVIANPFIIMIFLLIGPIICVLLQLVYVKHHLWITLDSRYIDYELKPDASTKLGLFGRRGKYFRDNLYKTKIPNLISKILGYAEGSFPSLVGILYLILFVGLWWSNKIATQMGLLNILLPLWFFLDIILIILAILAGILTRDSNYQYGIDRDSTLPEITVKKRE